ncbi:hypothetical protein EVAR_51877_1 [Eumeta japonica]|uniref:Uncharacterized protein n=1 Tax=Eumeta variegata TaxID=151549 RepID=A0A4C1YLR0_EUMVA|nr:hypothetical protein EVAR_51877_1 [Eumeta japonica]
MAKEAVNCLFYGKPSKRWYDYIATQKEDSAELPHMAEFLNRARRRCADTPPEDLHARLSGTSQTNETRRIQRARTHHREIASTAYKARSCLICNGDHPMSACLMKETISPSLEALRRRDKPSNAAQASDRPRVGAAHRQNRAPSGRDVSTSLKQEGAPKIVPIRLTGPKANIDTLRITRWGFNNHAHRRSRRRSRRGGWNAGALSHRRCRRHRRRQAHRNASH